MSDKLPEFVEQKLDELRIAHHYCYDPWYSCPKHPEGCANDRAGEECDCGADVYNQRIDDLRAFLAQYVLCEKEPIARVLIHKTGGNAGIAWHAVPTGIMPHDGMPLHAPIKELK